MANWKTLLRAGLFALLGIHLCAQEPRRITVYAPSSTSEGGAWSPRVALNARAVAFASGGRVAGADGVIGRRNVNVYYKDISTSTRLVSVNFAGLPGNGDSYAPEISANGRFVLFESSASDLITNDFNGGIDLFRRDIVTGQTVLVSARPQVSSIVGLSGNGNSTHGLLSADGNKVAFDSTATDLTSFVDSNYGTDVFVRDIVSGVTTPVSVSRPQATLNSMANGPSRLAAISEDANYVLFYSYASNLLSTNIQAVNPPVERLYLRDIVARTTDIISYSPSNVYNFGVTHACMNRNGSIAAFITSSRLLSSTNPANQTNIFIRILPTQETLSVPLPMDISTNAARARLFMSPGGSRLALTVSARATNLVGEFQPPRLLLWDLFTETLEEIDLAPYGVMGTNALTVRFITPAHLMVGPLSKLPISPPTNTIGGEGIYIEPFMSDDFSAMIDGSYMAYQSKSTNDAVEPQVYFKTSATISGALLSYAQDGYGREQGDFRIHTLPTLPSNRDKFIFSSTSSSLVPNDDNGFSDIFLWDRTNDVLRVVAQGNGPSYEPAISANGQWVAFISAANNFTANDTNRTEDVYVKNLQTDEVELISVQVAAKTLQPPGSTHATVISADGRYVAYSTLRDDLAEGPLTRTREHVLLRDRQEGVTHWITQQFETNISNFRAKPIAIFGSNVWIRAKTNVYRYSMAENTNYFIGRSDIDPVFSSTGDIAVLRTRQTANNVVQTFDLTSNTLSTLFSLGTNRLYRSRISLNDAGDVAFVTELPLVALDTDTTNDIYIASPTRPLALATGHTIPGATTSIDGPVYDATGSRLYFRELLKFPLSSVRAEAPPPIADLYYMQFFNGSPAFLQAVTNGPEYMRAMAFGDGVVIASEDLHYYSPNIYLDSDNDGLIDAWEFQMFGTLNFDGEADTDGDGLSNRSEFLAGTNPNSSASALRVSIEPSGSLMKITFPQSADGSFQLQYRTNLIEGDWLKVPGNVTVRSDGSLSMQWDSSVEPQAFYRLLLQP